jgi:hypothetical protein
LEDNRDIYWVATLYQMDIERVRYSLARYLRTRVLKIEKYLEYVISNTDIYDRLSTEEQVTNQSINQSIDSAAIVEQLCSDCTSFLQ